MAIKKQSLVKLSGIFEEHKSNQTDMVFRNMFSTACYLSMLGEHEAARKHLRSLFDWLGWDRRTVYFNAIQESFSEFASEYAVEIAANMEINKLFYKFEAAKCLSENSPNEQ